MASKYVVTAAHCFKTKFGQILGEQDVVVRLGEHSIDITGETHIPEKTVRISKIIKHENHVDGTTSEGTYMNDIALLELADEVDLNVYTPACLARSTDINTFDGMIAQVYGWGRIIEDGAPSSILLEVDIPVVTYAECNRAMGVKYPETPNNGQICAGGVEGQDACEVEYESSILMT